MSIKQNDLKIIKKYNQVIKILNQQQPLKEYIKLGQQLMKNDYLDEAQAIFLQLERVYPVNSKKILQYIEKINLLQSQKIEKISKNHQDDKEYLFISGTARSGTTALWRLLNFSDEILLGMERYLTKENYLHPNKFEFNKFFSDKICQKRPHIYEPLKDKYKTCRYIGDKIPGFLFGWNESKKNFSEKSFYIIHIMRNIYDIAWSFSERADAKKANLKKGRGWSVDRDYQAALYEFNKNNQILTSLINSNQVGSNWLIIRYEDIYSSKNLMISLFKWLNVKITEELIEKITVFSNDSSEIINKERKLDTEHFSYIENHLDRETLNIINSVCDRHLQLINDLK